MVAGIEIQYSGSSYENLTKVVKEIIDRVGRRGLLLKGPINLPTKISKTGEKKYRIALVIRADISVIRVETLRVPKRPEEITEESPEKEKVIERVFNVGVMKEILDIPLPPDVKIEMIYYRTVD